MEEFVDITLNWENATQGTQFTIVKLGASAGGCDVSTAYSENILGILQNKPKQNQAARVRVYGPSKLVASTGIALGAYITSTTAGAGVTCATTLYHAVALAMFEAASGAAHIFKVWVLGPGFKFVV